MADEAGTVTVRLDEAVAGLGLKVADAPAGRPVTLRLTDELKPPLGVIVTV